MTAILALDIGDKRIGIATADLELGHITPMGTFERANGAAERQIIELIADKSIQTVLVGLPLNEDGTRSEQCSKVETFCRRLEKRSTAKVIFVDEYGTSYEAMQRLQASGISEREARKKGLIDSHSAAILIEDYLRKLKG